MRCAIPRSGGVGRRESSNQGGGVTPRTLGVACATALVALAAAGSAMAAERQQSYTVKLRNTADLELLARSGQDVTEGRRGTRIEIVATGSQARKLRAQGLTVRLTRDRRGRTILRANAAQAATGWKVWRPYARTDVEVSPEAGNPTDNIKTQLEKLAQKHRNIAELQTIGRTIMGVPIYAMKVTKDARHRRDGSRPAVLYSSVQHAREWLAGETGRRTLRLFLDNYGRKGAALGTDGQPVLDLQAKEITKLVDRTELWFVLVANPDGYDYTFTPANRLWRKNLRDNDGDGQITNVDGVDPNRNFPTHWGYDDEGSSPIPVSETYRGTAPASEPETRALDGLMRRIRFAWNKNDHTFGPLLLWPSGWQFDTHEADEPIFRTIAGTERANSAIPTFHPRVGSDLYTTNGDTNDHAYDTYKTISFTPEGTPAATGSGFVFQDVEADVQAEFERHVQFALDMARSADDPSDPESYQGRKAPNFEVSSFDVSYGSPQTVQVNARRDLGRVELKYRINGGRTRDSDTWEWRGGERYGASGDNWYHRLRGKVYGADPGDTVKVWFESRRKRSESFTYTLQSDTNARVLILAAEDYTGTSQLPDYASTTAPNFLSYYEDALRANGIRYAVYDIDAMGRRAPDPLGVLSHFDAVIWYTGNDNVTRTHNLAGRSDKLPHDTQIAVRDFMNEGGRLLYTGKFAGRQYTLAEYPVPGATPEQCDGVPGDQNWDEPCKDLSNDFLQYWLGSYARADAGGVNDDGSLRRFVGVSDPLAGFTGALDGLDSAQNQADAAHLGTGTHLITSSILDPETHPDFQSRVGASWEGAGAFTARTGSWFMHSQVVDQGWKRLTRTIDLTGQTSGSLEFWANWNTETDWDWMVVEAHTVGQDNWTTLPDLNGHTSQGTGQSCPAGDDYFALHPFIAHYITRTGSGSAADPWVCTPGGTTGTWHQANGQSAGYEQWRVDLSQFAGSQVEVSISLISDWSVGEIPGILLDDVTIRRGAAVETTSFEDDMGGFAVPGAPPGSFNGNDWVRTQRAYEEGSVATTPDSLYFGFGFEGVTDASQRNELMRRSMQYLLR
jgi:Zinc carboxypeptidase